MSKIMLLDGNSLINRAFYAIPVLTNPEGQFVNGVYGFLSIFVKLYNEEKPDIVIAAFDLPKPTFRHKMYAEYKGTRKPMADELRPQIPMLKELLRKMRIAVCELEGFEADDILGAYARKAEALGHEVSLVSGDRDLLQIATDKVKIRIPKTKGGKTEVEDYYAADVLEKIGLSPAEFIDMKALMGDASDNIPGVPGIGEKTAQKIIAEYKSVECAIANAANVKPKKASENLVVYAEQARLSRILAEINTDAPVPDVMPEPVSKEDVFNPDARAEVERLDFKSFLPLFAKGDAAPGIKSVEYTKILVKDMDALKGLAEKLSGDQPSAFRFIMDGDAPIAAAFCNSEDKAFCVDMISELSAANVLSVLRPYFEGASGKLCFDMKDEINFLRRNGVELGSPLFDLSLAAYLLDSSRESREYDDIAREMFGRNELSYGDFFGTGKNKKSYTALNCDFDQLLDFACAQAHVIFSAYQPMRGKLGADKLGELYDDIEFPLVFVLGDMEKLGIKVDRAALTDFGVQLDAKIDTVCAEIYEYAGEKFNISSPKQLGVILYERLGLHASKRTKSGYSTDAETLAEIADDHPIVGKVLDYRSYTKLKSTYVDGLLAVMGEDDKIHSTFNQFVTATGRISSTEPNLQNIPIRYELGRELRKVFIPSDGFVFLDADYSQIELRVLAHISGDQDFIRAFKDGVDIHRMTAAQVNGIPLEFVSSEQRTQAKAVNFGIVYGISSFRLARDLNISVREAGDYINSYFERYPGVREYLDESKKSAKSRGYAQTIWGRRRYIPELKSGNFNQRSAGERIAMNMPIQGSAADIIKIAMVNVHAKLKELGLKSRLILQVHDELLVEAHEDELEQVSAILKQEMENAAELLVPLVAEVGRGASWYEAH